MELSLEKWYRILAPRPAVLVSTISAKGIANAAPFSFVSPVSADPPLIAFASDPEHDTARNILETKDFVVNLPSRGIIGQLWACAGSLPPEKSEFDASGLKAEKSLKVKSPGVRECFGRFECRLEDHYTTGDHVLFVGRVLRAYIRDDLMKGGRFLAEKSDFLLHIGGPEFGLLGETIKVK